MANILIIDDDEMFCRTMARALSRGSRRVESLHTLAEGLEAGSSGLFDVVLVDVRMPDGNGLDLLPRFRDVPAPPEVIIVTGGADPDGAELAMKNGAWDYIEKSASLKSMMLPVLRALEYREQKRAKRSMAMLKRENIIGGSSQMQQSLEMALKAASTDANILIFGETGTGKELFARAIHENSARAKGPFVTVDCASLPPTVTESILFGHEKGSFTGAERRSMGLIKNADGGTLFLDEIGELSLEMQKTFLRVLQEKRFRPIGSKHEVNSDFRLVAATNRSLEEMVEQGRFRSDLLYRLSAFTLELPPLRSRANDIKELAIHYVSKLCDKHGKSSKGFVPEFMDALVAYGWPGNVREFINAIERAILVAGDEPTLYPKHLPVNIRVDLARSSVRDETSHPGGANGLGGPTSEPTPFAEAYPARAAAGGNGQGAAKARPLEAVQASAVSAAGPGGASFSAPSESADQFGCEPGPSASPAQFPKLKAFRRIAAAEAERRYLRDLIACTGGNLKQVCRVSGLSRSRLYELLKKHNLPSRLHGA